MSHKQMLRKKQLHLPAFTLLELMITISVIAVLAAIITFAFTSTQKTTRDTARDTQVRIISDALEKYYRTNGEYPSVALMTSSNVNTVKTRLGITDPSVLRLPLASADNSIGASDPSETRLVYMANTSDSTKNTQCQTDINGYCDGFSLQYKKEGNGQLVTIMSLHDTFTPLAEEGGGGSPSTCNDGDTQSGNTCTHTYAATYQTGSYSCPSGGTLSGSTCTSTYNATYTPPPVGVSVGMNLPATTMVYNSGTFQCTNAGSLGCMAATYTTNGNVTNFQCTNAGSLGCMAATYSGASSGTFQCTNAGSLGCMSATTTLNGATVDYHCTNAGSLGCMSASYTVTGGAVGMYSCSSGDTINGTTCTHTYSATQGSGYYTCPNGGTLSGTTCTYTYQLQ